MNIWNGGPRLPARTHRATPLRQAIKNDLVLEGVPGLANRNHEQAERSEFVVLEFVHFLF